MTTSSFFFRVLLTGPTVAVLVTGCANNIGTGSKPKYVEGVEARVAITGECPRARQGRRSESAVPAALAGTLIPPLIDASLDFVDVTLRDATDEHTTTASASTVGLFYQARRIPTESSPPFEVQRNGLNGCLVVAYGPMSKDVPSTGFDALEFDSIQQTILRDELGLQGDPHFYYEGRVVYSPDHSAFRIEGANIRYTKTLEDERPGVRDLELSLKFLSPSATGKEKTFAMGIIPIGPLSTGTDLLGGLKIGTGTVAKFSSPWMPLPSIDEKVKQLLAEARTAIGNLGSTLSDLKTTYSRHVNPNVADAIGSDRWEEVGVEEFLRRLNGEHEHINRAVQEFDKKIETLNAEVTQKTYQLDEGIRKLNLKLILEEQGLEGVDALIFERDSKLKAMIARTGLNKQRSELESAVHARAAVKALATASRDLGNIKGNVEQLASVVRSFGPFTVEVAVSERRERNPVLKFFADVFSSAKPSLRDELKAALDPKTKRELEEKELQEAEKRQDEFLTLRKAAALAVRMVRGAEIKLRLLGSTAGEIERHDAETKLHTAVLDAAYACQRAARRSAQPTECAPYL